MNTISKLDVTNSKPNIFGGKKRNVPRQCELTFAVLAIRLAIRILGHIILTCTNIRILRKTNFEEEGDKILIIGKEMQKVESKYRVKMMQPSYHQKSNFQGTKSMANVLQKLSK